MHPWIKQAYESVLYSLLWLVNPQKARTKKLTAEFINAVDLLVGIFGLDPDLPEVAKLKKKAALYAASPIRHIHLADLNPHKDIRWHDGALHVVERPFGHVLETWTIARHHIYEIDRRVASIFAGETGTHLFDVYGHKLVTFEAGSINPTRLADPGNRYEIACAIINEFTGLDTDYRDHWGRTMLLTATLSDAGWTLDSKLHPHASASN